MFTHFPSGGGRRIAPNADRYKESVITGLACGTMIPISLFRPRPAVSYGHSTIRDCYQTVNVILGMAIPNSHFVLSLTLENQAPSWDRHPPLYQTG